MKSTLLEKVDLEVSTKLSWGGKVVAVKRLNVSDSGNNIPELSCQSFENEIRTLTEVRHRNIVKLYGFCSWRDCLYLVYEYADRGSLRKELYGVEGQTQVLGWDARVKIVQELAHAISYLHNDCSSPIVHRDITLNNPSRISCHSYQTLESQGC